MRLLRYGPAGSERPGALDANGVARDLSDLVDDIDADTLNPSRLAVLHDALCTPDRLRPVDLTQHRTGPPVAAPGTVVCVGLNYTDHAREAGAEPPDEPVLFLKANNTICGPNDDVVCPPGAQKLDWEVELAIVIGRPAYALDTEEEAWAAVAGFCLSHDVSERAFQFERGGQWTKGKSSPTFNPLGPWLVTADELAPGETFPLQTKVNGQTVQKSSTGEMIFSPAFLVRYISQFVALRPGDVINTGTPAGVGHGQVPPSYLRSGDVVELSAGRLGEQRQRVVAGDRRRAS